MRFAFNNIWKFLLLLLLWAVSIIITSFGFAWLFVYEWNYLVFNLLANVKEVTYWSVYPQLAILWLIIGLTGLNIKS